MNKALLALLLFALPTFARAAPNPQPPAAQPLAAQPLAEPSFPLVMYAVPATDAAFARAKSWGINYVHSYGLGMDVTKDQQFFDLAAQHGLKVAANLNGTRRVGVAGGLEAMRAYVRHFKAHPALGFWYLFDEPDNHHIKPDALEPFYRMLKEETPNVPVAVCHAWTTGWYRYGQVQDILVNDIYPVTGAPFPQAKLLHFTKFAEAALRSGQSVIPVVQFFNWQGLAKPDENELRGYPIAELRYPNAAEMRYMCFSAIAQGVNGLAFYSYARSTPPDPQWAEQTAAPVLRAVRTFINRVRTTPLQRRRAAEENQLLLSRWTGKSTYILLANASPETRRIEQAVDGSWPDGELRAWGETRAVEATLQDGKITVAEAKPWEIFIWSVAP